MELSREQLESYLTPEFKAHESQNTSKELIQNVSTGARTKVFLAYNLMRNRDAGAAFVLSVAPKTLVFNDDIDDRYSQETLRTLSLSVAEFIEINCQMRDEADCDGQPDDSSVENYEDILTLVANEKQLDFVIDCIKMYPDDVFYYLLICSILAKNFHDEKVLSKIEEFVSYYLMKIFDTTSEDTQIEFAELMEMIVIRSSGKISKQMRKVVSDFLSKIMISVENCFSDNSSAINSICSIAAYVQDKSFIPYISKHLMSDLTAQHAEKALLALGVSQAKIENIKKQTEPETKPEKVPYDYNDLKPHQQAAYKLLSEEKTCKRMVFERAKVLDGITAKQEFITIHTPALAQKAYECLLRKIGNKTAGFERLLKDSLGLKLKEIDEQTFIYFADEILDIVSNFTKGTKLQGDLELTSILAEMVDTDGVKIRYITRTKSDLSLGDKCGDCTAKGSVNHKASILWNVNPVYQIATIEEGKSFMGRVNLTLGYVDNKAALIVDAHEFNPQAEKEPSFEERAKKAFDKTIKLLAEKAKAMGREFHFSTISNSSESRNFLYEYGEPNRKKALVQLLDAEEDLQNILAIKGYKGDVPLFYQLASLDGEEDHQNAINQPLDPRIQKLEATVLNPAQIANSEIAAAMRSRNWKEAAKLLASSTEFTNQIKAVYNLPATIGIGAEFIEKKLDIAYPQAEVKQEKLRRVIKIDSRKLIKIA